MKILLFRKSEVINLLGQRWRGVEWKRGLRGLYVKGIRRRMERKKGIDKYECMMTDEGRKWMKVFFYDEVWGKKGDLTQGVKSLDSWLWIPRECVEYMLDGEWMCSLYLLMIMGRMGEWGWSNWEYRLMMDFYCKRHKDSARKFFLKRIREARKRFIDSGWGFVERREIVSKAKRSGHRVLIKKVYHNHSFLRRKYGKRVAELYNENTKYRKRTRKRLSW